jgi:hypothetical protein
MRLDLLEVGSVGKKAAWAFLRSRMNSFRSDSKESTSRNLPEEK